MPEFTSEIVKVFKNQFLKDILFIENACFPKDWQYNDPEQYYTEVLRNRKNIIIFLKDINKTVGCIISIQHDTARKELIQYDPEMKSDNARYYIDSIAVLPQYRDKGGAKKLIYQLCDEANERGIYKFSIHARTVNGLNILIKKIFEKMITGARKIESWAFGGGEPYDYIEWTYRVIKGD